LIVILGAPYSGKTTIIEQFIAKEKEKTLIVVPDDKDWINIFTIDNMEAERFTYKGIKKRIWEDNSDLKSIFERFSDGLLVFEDCRPLFHPSLEKYLHLLLSRKRQGRRDIIASAHGFTEVPPKFFTFATEFVLFNTLDSIASRKDVIKEYDQVKALQTFVNEKAKHDPHFCRSFKR